MALSSWWQILAYGQAHDLFRHERFMRMFGWLYLRYEREWFWWEGTIMLRRGLLVVTLVLAARFPSLQIIAGMAICATALTIHFYARPFVSQQLDYLEQFSLISLVGLICTGILFFDEAARAEHAAWETVATVLTMLCLFGSLALVIVMVALDVRYEEAISRAQRQLRSSILRVLDLHKPGHDKSAGRSVNQRPALFGSVAKRVRQAVALRNSIQPSTYSDGGQRRNASNEEESVSAGTVEPPGHRAVAREEDQRWAMARKAVEAEPLELHRSLDIVSVRKWLASLEVSSDCASDSVAQPVNLPKWNRQTGVKQQILQLLSRSEPSESTRDTMPSTMNVYNAKLSAKVQAGLVRFWLTNHWMHAALADTSPVSHYSHRPGSVFFGNIVAGAPFLLDHMLYASETQLADIKAVLNYMRAAQPVFGSGGRLAKLISAVHRGPLLSWLMIADPDRITTFRRLLQDVYEVNHEGWHPLSASARRMDANRFAAWIDKVVWEYLPKPERFGFETEGAYYHGSEDGTQSIADSSVESGDHDLMKAVPLISGGGKVPSASARGVQLQHPDDDDDDKRSSTSSRATSASRGMEDTATAIPAVTASDAKTLQTVPATPINLTPPHPTALVSRNVDFQDGELSSPFEVQAGPLADKATQEDGQQEEGRRRSEIVVSKRSKGELARLDDALRELSGFGSDIETYLCSLERKITQKLELTTANKNFRRQRSIDGSKAKPARSSTRSSRLPWLKRIAAGSS